MRFFLTKPFAADDSRIENETPNFPEDGEYKKFVGYDHPRSPIHFRSFVISRSVLKKKQTIDSGLIRTPQISPNPPEERIALSHMVTR